MKSPSKEHERKFNKKYAIFFMIFEATVLSFASSRNLPIVPVVIDPIVARYLRPHQKEGLSLSLSGVARCKLRFCTQTS
jgi:DNA repair and recombination protein RAD54B